MAKPYHKLRINSQRMIFLDDKPIKGIQAMQFNMDVKNPTLGLLQLVMIAGVGDIEHEKVEVNIKTDEPKPETPKAEEAKAV